MVIGPKELIEKIEANEKSEIKRLEERIDKTLRHKFDESGYVKISYDNFEIRNFVLYKILEKYKQAGWTSVEVVDNQREGCYLEFMVKDNNFR